MLLILQEPADETAVLASTTAVVETAAQPELPVSTGGTVGTHVLTSQPQLGPPTASNQVVTQEIVAQEIVADTDAVEPEVLLAPSQLAILASVQVHSLYCDCQLKFTICERGANLGLHRLMQQLLEHAVYYL